jgi:hypothetical protein
MPTSPRRSARREHFGAFGTLRTSLPLAAIVERRLVG